MPIYEYRCSSCEVSFEKLMKFTDSAPGCPRCNRVDVRKVISQSGFVLKGSGWYRDGYGLKTKQPITSGEK
jgi:putative FmdB family regulatory protein